MTVCQLLVRARAKIVKGWCKGEMAYDAKGNVADPESRNACKWCAAGAIAAIDSTNVYMYSEAIHEIRKANRIGFLTEWNDAPGRRKSHVLRAFDKAIAATRKRPVRKTA